MKVSIAAILLASASSVTNAFVPTTTSTCSLSALKGGMSSDVGIPCEDECAIEKYPNLPESIHPGVLSGQAMMDLLDHAKEHGTSSMLILIRV